MIKFIKNIMSLNKLHERLDEIENNCNYVLERLEELEESMCDTEIEVYDFNHLLDDDDEETNLN